MELDFVLSCRLVRRWRLVSGSCSSARVFACPFFQTTLHSDALGVRLSFTSIRLDRDFHPELSNMLGTQKKRRPFTERRFQFQIG
jgi:hypothetical protein